ncbi:putative dUTPase [Mitosporidium daphniae]|uniref:Deoxyuridine 5'-triphosphate nucleotidohydrolase n=1 Tax=Mitosporidium daphniae TaxID=1485682 RepID=A0A098VV56_9MICR|nr:putative dUTPase [Mitosporidium daphniae]KGG51606.1 putative dUTPase [Mitosporidium daphniae]|eukprot:XP_013238033.1 putative dUTPase [Mitosporidium daphniae]
MPLLKWKLFDPKALNGDDPEALGLAEEILLQGAQIRRGLLETNTSIEGCNFIKMMSMIRDETQCGDSLFVTLLSENGQAPQRLSENAAGYDLFSAKDAIVPKQGRLLVPTDIAIAVPLGTYGRVAPRSGIALKHGIDVGAGVIDADYRGNVGVLLFNTSTEADFSIKKGDRIAQLILEKIATPEVRVVQSLTETVRGSGGFGSTN